MVDELIVVEHGTMQKIILDSAIYLNSEIHARPNLSASVVCLNAYFFRAAFIRGLSVQRYQTALPDKEHTM
jgi:hypothetical protein